MAYGTEADVWSVGHPCLEHHNTVKLPPDIIIFKLMKVYMRLSPLRKTALRVGL
ncbi:putative non-specific serine/threonine protein kinase [Rosa chinensis]|uniref:Putative non-specific serine/threonine protein kinase n=1 Tax=Rosa chinensis TaxID=74649 RepID=A0A2P6QI97_ROSCH|nr:putative non-specific serine/threonine protein kinase [Rosa chinensis]